MLFLILFSPTLRFRILAKTLNRYMNDASFHWRKFDAAHWILSKISTSQKQPYRDAKIVINQYGFGEKKAFPYYKFKYLYEQRSFTIKMIT